MRRFLRVFLETESGQDLIEFTLLMAFVCLASAALFVSSGQSVQAIWSVADGKLGVANATLQGDSGPKKEPCVECLP
jgi:Flp pilus assembly pilin Flp